MDIAEPTFEKVWRGATTQLMVVYMLGKCGGYGVDPEAEMDDKIKTLGEILARLIDVSPLTDRQKLDVVGMYNWDIVK